MIRPDTDALIAFLNEVAATDGPALVALIRHRVPCSTVLADHPSVQVAAGDPPTVGFLGLLNGYAGTIEGGSKDGWGPITANIDGEAVQFCRTEEWADAQARMIDAYGPSPDNRSPRELFMALVGTLPGLVNAGLVVTDTIEREKVFNEERSAQTGIECYDLGKMTIDIRITGTL